MIRNDEAVEAAAKAIYDMFKVDARCNKPVWVVGGNSFKQDEARDYARAAIEALPFRTVTNAEALKALNVIDWDIGKFISENGYGENIETIRAALIGASPKSEPLALEAAAQAVIDRWDTPAWKEAEPTAFVIGRLRAALNASVSDIAQPFMSEMAAVSDVAPMGFPEAELKDLKQYFDGHPPETQLAAAYLKRQVHRYGNEVLTSGDRVVSGLWVKNTDATEAVRSALILGNVYLDMAKKAETEISDAKKYALSLAETLLKKHYPENAFWTPCDTVPGLISQIDNMVSILIRPPELDPKVLSELKAWRDNAEVMLTGYDDVVKCREGGGFEDRLKSLVLTVSHIRAERNAHREAAAQAKEANLSHLSHLVDISSALGFGDTPAPWYLPPLVIARMKSVNELSEKIGHLKNLRDIQCQQGNFDTDKYMLGMANGLILAVSTMTDEEPVFIKTPEKTAAELLRTLGYTVTPPDNGPVTSGYMHIIGGGRVTLTTDLSDNLIRQIEQSEPSEASKALNYLMDEPTSSPISGLTPQEVKLEWQDLILHFNGHIVGYIRHNGAGVTAWAAYFMDGAAKRFPKEDEARESVELTARAWLSGIKGG